VTLSDLFVPRQSHPALGIHTRPLLLVSSMAALNTKVMGKLAAGLEGAIWVALEAALVTATSSWL
jgi:hypothetical protein